MTSYVFLTVGGRAGRVTSLIVLPYIREQTINDTAKTKNIEGVFTHSSPRSSAPVTDHGTPAAFGSTGPVGVVTELRTGVASLPPAARSRPQQLNHLRTASCTYTSAEWHGWAHARTYYVLIKCPAVGRGARARDPVRSSGTRRPDRRWSPAIGPRS